MTDTLTLVRRPINDPYSMAAFATCKECLDHFGTGWPLWGRELDELAQYHATHRLEQQP